MRKLNLIAALILLSIGVWAQRATVYIATQLPIDYQVFIDDYPQRFGYGSSYKIISVPTTAKQLSLQINTPSQQTPSIMLNTAGKKEVFYTIVKEGDKYKLVQAEHHNFLKEKRYVFAAYIAKPKPVKQDTGYKQPHSCKVPDSVINQAITNVLLLKDNQAKQTFLASVFGRKCLSAEQIRSIGYRLDEDELKLNVYQDFYLTSLDRSNYKILKSSFKTETYAQRFNEWWEKASR